MQPIISLSHLYDMFPMALKPIKTVDLLVSRLDAGTFL